MPEAIKVFTGEYRFLSNFYECPVELDGVLYRSVENAFQAAKALDKNLRVPFETMTPGKAKQAGRKLPLRATWEKGKESVMEALLFEKFSKHTDLRDKLLATGTRSLVEGNWWHDLYWGCCYCDEHKWAGENRLGVLIMRVRAKIGRLTETDKLSPVEQ